MKEKCKQITPFPSVQTFDYQLHSFHSVTNASLPQSKPAVTRPRVYERKTQASSIPPIQKKCTTYTHFLLTSTPTPIIALTKSPPHYAWLDAQTTIYFSAQFSPFKEATFFLNPCIACAFT